MAMKRSEDRILTTHGGNLPRPVDLDKLIAEGESKRAEIDARVPSAVAEVVDKQLECGVTILNDGEYVKAAHGSDYVGYIHGRITGWEDLPVDPSQPPKRQGVAARDRKDFPGFYESGLWLSGSGGPVRPGFGTPGAAPAAPATERVATSAVKYVGHDAIGKDVDAMLEAVKGRDDVQGFIAALGPLSLGAGARNAFYDSEEDYMMAVAEVMREEYKAVTDAGLVLQVDEPEFATTWMFYPEWSIEDYRRYLEFAAEVINHSIEGLPADQIRFHMCWGSGHRPHTNDVPLKDIADILMKVDASAYAVESSNVRHQHEWKVWEDVKLAEGKTLVPGVVGHYTDLVEHPEVVAARLINFASVVGKENVQAGTDCGIGSRVGHAEIVWAKLRAMSDGAELASKELWKR
jgi:5-methyltetrahydropteroyltriglutamate--homocysteine methyltransferase